MLSFTIDLSDEILPLQSKQELQPACHYINSHV